MVIGYGIIKKGYVVDVLPYKSTGNNITAGNSSEKKVDKCNDGSTTMSVKLDIYGLIYRNIPLKDVNNVEILSRMYSDPQKSENIVTIL